MYLRGEKKKYFLSVIIACTQPFTPILLETSIIASSEHLAISLLQSKCKMFHPPLLKQSHLSLSETLSFEGGFSLGFSHLLTSQSEICPFIMKRNIELKVA